RHPDCGGEEGARLRQPAEVTGVGPGRAEDPRLLQAKRLGIRVPAPRQRRQHRGRNLPPTATCPAPRALDMSGVSDVWQMCTASVPPAPRAVRGCFPRVVTPPRPIPAGAVFHVTTRAIDRRRLFVDSNDHEALLRYADRAAERYGWRVLAYCLMTNHVHWVIETPMETLDRAMKHVNQSYAQRF